MWQHDLEHLVSIIPVRSDPVGTYEVNEYVLMGERHPHFAWVDRPTDRLDLINRHLDRRWGRGRAYADKRDKHDGPFAGHSPLSQSPGDPPDQIG